jgi:hypothetical protein
MSSDILWPHLQILWLNFIYVSSLYSPSTLSGFCELFSDGLRSRHSSLLRRKFTSTRLLGTVLMSSTNSVFDSRMRGSMNLLASSNDEDILLLVSLCIYLLFNVTSIVPGRSCQQHQKLLLHSTDLIQRTYILCKLISVSREPSQRK